MKKNIEKLASLGEEQLEKVLEGYLGKLKETLEVLNKSEVKNSGALNPLLSDYKILYEQGIKNFGNEFGIEFPKLQKQYEVMLPQINKYLELTKN